jgi:hypothetical protein
MFSQFLDSGRHCLAPSYFTPARDARIVSVARAFEESEERNPAGFFDNESALS